MWILLVEDDAKQAELIEKALQEAFPDVEVRHYSTESQFRESLPRLVEHPPALIVMDVMLRWCDAGPDMPLQPRECEDFSMAGVRCCRLLKSNPKTRNVPVVVLTVLDKNGFGLPTGCVHASKASDFKALINAANHLITRM